MKIDIGSLAASTKVGHIINIRGKSVPADAQGLSWKVTAIEGNFITVELAENPKSLYLNVREG